MNFLLHDTYVHVSTVIDHLVKRLSGDVVIIHYQQAVRRLDRPMSS